MPKTVTCAHECALPAHEFWALRSDIGFDRHIGKVDKQTVEWTQNEPFTSKDGKAQLRRTSRVSFEDNPVPKVLRGMLGASSPTITVLSTLYVDEFDEAHPFSFKTSLPFLTDKITTEGIEWCEPIDATRCRFCARVSIRAKVLGVSGQIESAILQGTQAAYKALPRHAEDYRATLPGSPAAAATEPSAAAAPEPSSSAFGSLMEASSGVVGYGMRATHKLSRMKSRLRPSRAKADSKSTINERDSKGSEGASGRSRSRSANPVSV